MKIDFLKEKEGTYDEVPDEAIDSLICLKKSLKRKVF